MVELTLDYFAAGLGDGWEMEVNGGRIPVTLIEASALPDSGRTGGSFRLEFVGPVDPAFQQGTFRFSREGDENDIFVTAISRDEGGTHYEAIFY